MKNTVVKMECVNIVVVLLVKLNSVGVEDH